MRASTAIGYRPDAGSASRLSERVPASPASAPITAPAASWYAAIPTAAASAGVPGPATPGAARGGWVRTVPLSRVTASTAAASLSPDSASSIPDSRGGNGSLRRTANTAAASVGASTALSRRASCHPNDISQWHAAASTAMLTATPTVASVSAAGAAALAWAQLVVRPPSARISTRAPVPSARASSGLSNRTPRPASPSARPRPRKPSRSGARSARLPPRKARRPPRRAGPGPGRLRSQQNAHRQPLRHGSQVMTLSDHQSVRPAPSGKKPDRAASAGIDRVPKDPGRVAEAGSPELDEGNESAAVKKDPWWGSAAGASSLE